MEAPGNFTQGWRTVILALGNNKRLCFHGKFQFQLRQVERVQCEVVLRGTVERGYIGGWGLG